MRGYSADAWSTTTLPSTARRLPPREGRQPPCRRRQGGCRPSRGGSRLAVDGKVVVDQASAEYPRIYERFAALVRDGRSEVDEAPFRLVADAFMIGRRIAVEPFAS